MAAQSSDHMLMIRPAAFYANEQTQDSNVYQDHSLNNHDESLKRAQDEFEAYVSLLHDNHVKVSIFDGSADCPDHIFPNWMSFHENEGYAIYPMRAQNRRDERLPTMIAAFNDLTPCRLDWTAREEDGQYLESTGSFVLDRVNKRAYAGLSARTDGALFQEFCDEMGYTPYVFETMGKDDKPVYHTDLMLFIGTDMVGFCPEVITSGNEDSVLASLHETHGAENVLILTQDQIDNFCGNALEVRGIDGGRHLCMSFHGASQLDEAQKALIDQHFDSMITPKIDTIERLGGGSARCMLQEIF